MRLQDFIDALYAAGWQATHDAQHAQIEVLHEKLFPVLARVDKELTALEQELFDKGIEL